MQTYTAQTLTRRHFLRLLSGALGFFFGVSDSVSSPSVQSQKKIIDRFLGESLFYQIGFWLIPRCGAAQTSFLQTENSRLYRAAIEGRTTGIIDVLIGRIRYSFVSYMEYVAAEVEGWLSSGGLPMRGTLKDVIFFGDLWGELDYQKVEQQNKTVPVPDAVRRHMRLI